MSSFMGQGLLGQLANKGNRSGFGLVGDLMSRKGQGASSAGTSILTAMQRPRLGQHVNDPLRL